MNRQASTEANSRTTRKLALITGASAGIGEAFARAYAARGCDLALVARRGERLNGLGAELSAAHGVEAFSIVADLAVFDAHKPILKAVADRGRHVDILVNNAGFGIPQSFVGVSWEKQRDFLLTLAVSPCGLAYGVIPGMVERGQGAIVNVASMAGFSPGVAGNTLYPGAKSLMIKFSQALDAEYRAKGLKITAICPGSTASEFAAQAGIQEIMDSGTKLPSQSAEAVVEAAIAGNERGKVVVIPGVHNKIAALLMRHLPEVWVRSIIGAGSAKYYLGE